MEHVTDTPHSILFLRIPPVEPSYEEIKLGIDEGLAHLKAIVCCDDLRRSIPLHRSIPQYDCSFDSNK